jgi:Arc/MetJ family transcription regulator
MQEGIDETYIGEGKTYMRKHTTINLDYELLLEAQRALGTNQTTETIHRALKEVVNRERRRRLLEIDFPGLTAESLEKLRQNRFTGEPNQEQTA